MERIYEALNEDKNLIFIFDKQTFFLKSVENNNETLFFILGDNEDKVQNKEILFYLKNKIKTFFKQNFNFFRSPVDLFSSCFNSCFSLNGKNLKIIQTMQNNKDVYYFLEELENNSLLFRIDVSFLLYINAKDEEEIEEKIQEKIGDFRKEKEFLNYFVNPLENGNFEVNLCFVNYIYANNKEEAYQKWIDSDNAKKYYLSKEFETGYFIDIENPIE